MTIRFCVLTLVGLFGLGDWSRLLAQPPVPVRPPTFTPFLGVMGRGAAGIGGYYGLYRPNLQLQQLQAEIAQNYQALANLQAAVTTMVSSGLPQTGRGAVYNNLGHWYPASRFGGAGGGMVTGPRYGMVQPIAPALPMGNAGIAGVAVMGGVRR